MLSLSSTSFNYQDILKITHLNINKAHGYDNISIRLLKSCDSSIVKPPTSVNNFQELFAEWIFS